nr:proton-coupled amino acid transporter-like protein CG1139 isoform X1 [Helicoverpa armigera]
MAAFERVSSTFVKPLKFNEPIDIRRFRLPSLRPVDDDYNPRDHRNPAKPIKPWMAYFNVLRTLLGPGMLIMPLAIAQAGLILGPIIALIYGCVLAHTHIMLLNCLNEIARQVKIPYISYRYGFRLAILHGPPFLHWIGTNGPTIIAVFMICSQLGVCTIFVILTSDSLRDLMDFQSNNTALLALLIPYLLMELLMKNVKVISYVSLIGTLMNAIGLVLVYYQCFSDPARVYKYAAADFMPIMYACGAYLCNLSAIGVMLSVDKMLKNPRLMMGKTGVIPVSMSVATFTCMSVGALGYWSFGSMEENVLRVLPLDEVTALIILAVYLVSVAFAFPIQCYPAIGVVLEVLKYHDPLNSPSPKTLKRVEVLGRPIFVLMTFTISYFIPFQAPVVAFVGNLCASMMSLVFPALMDTCLRYPNNYGHQGWRFVKNMIIITFGLVDWVFGALICGYIISVRVISRASPNAKGGF